MKSRSVPALPARRVPTSADALIARSQNSFEVCFSERHPTRVARILMSLPYSGRIRRARWARHGLCALLAFVNLVTVGCKVGPDFRKPAVPLEDAYIDAGHPRFAGDPVDPCAWWTSLGDPQLSALVRRAYGGNLTLREAGARILAARGQLSFSRGNLFPQSQLANGQYQRFGLSREAANRGFPGQVYFFDNWSIGLSAAWELDFWGKYRRAIESAEASLDQSVEEYDDALVLLTANVASTYVELRATERRLQLARENVRIQSGTLELVEIKRKGGSVTGLDVAQAETNLRETQSLIPLLENSKRQANNRLCVLLGESPRDLTPELAETGRIPNPPAALAVGVPADLLRRRPDVRAAERRLAAQSERIGIAQTDFYPQISILGSIGLVANDFKDLFNLSAVEGSIGPSFRWNILNYGRIRANVDVQRARFQELAYAYQQAVLDADEEAENAMVRFIKSHERLEYQRQSTDAAARSVRISLDQYRAGSTDFNRVFLLQTQLVQKQDAQTQTEGELAASYIAIFQALGGGWQIRLSEPNPRGQTPLPLPLAREEPTTPSQFEDQFRPAPPAQSAEQIEGASSSVESNADM